VKLDLLLAAYLYEHKTLTLQGLGTFSLDDSFQLPDPNEKADTQPLAGVHFHFDKRTETDPAVIDYLVQHMGKIKPLVAADLESHLSLVNQFINLGKPYVFEGIGTLNKVNDGSFVFKAGKAAELVTEAKTNNLPEEFVTEGFFSNQPKKNAAGNKTAAFYILLIVIIIIILGGTGWGIYTLLNNNDNASSPEPAAEEVVVETVDTIPPAATTRIVQNDSVTYKMILLQSKWKFKITPLYKTYSNYKMNVFIDSLVTNDTLRYRLYLPVTCLPADTTRIVDSLNKYYNKKVTIGTNP